jgi:hypothetical protein
MSLRSPSSEDPQQLHWSPVSYSPIPADLGISPVNQYFTYWSPGPGPVSEVVVQSIRPVAHLRRDFDIAGLKLADHEVRLPQ